MKKFIAGVLLIGLVASGCARGERARTDSRFGERNPGELTVGSDIPFEPFEFEVDGELTGFDIELIRAIAEEIGLEPRFVDADFETIFTQLSAGRFDVVASATTITEERKKQVAFTDPYYISQQAFVVNSARTPQLTSTDGLKSGDTVAVQDGTTGKDWAEENLAPKGVQVRTFPEAPDTYTALEAGSVTGVIFDEPSAVTEANNRANLKVVQVIDTGERYGFGVNPKLTRLLAAMNEALKKLISDGTYDQIYGKYEGLGPSGSVTRSS